MDAAMGHAHYCAQHGLRKLGIEPSGASGGAWIQGALPKEGDAPRHFRFNVPALAAMI
jgi:hypothetical protein